jgi:hypothetical protein
VPDDDLPLVLYQEDLAGVLRCSVRNVQRLQRARELPDPLPIPGRPRWSRQVILAWLSGAGKNMRRGRSVR